jgi:segregation and condensation protein A
MIEERYRVRLDDIFEGPMDLLVYLIRKNEVNIYDIPIALITDQYLEYIDWMKSMNIDLVGDFLVMAATLTQIKSKMLLPVHQGEDGDDEDPRLAVTRPLLEYLQMKSAAEDLDTRHLLGEDTFLRNPEKEDQMIEDEPEFIQVGLFELIDAFQNILKTISPEQRVELTVDKISVKEKISEIVDILEKKGSVTFTDLFSEKVDKEVIIVTFLAILEMVKLAIIRIFQHVESGIIRIFYQ